MLMIDVKKRLADGWMRCRAVIELVGKPKEHIESTMNSYVEKIKGEKDIEVVDVQISDIQKRETGEQSEEMVKDLWMVFAELDMLMKEPMTLTFFCFDYMPASVEIVEPATLSYSNDNLTEFFNDLQARLHQLDLIAKQLKSEVLFLRKSTKSLLQNYVMVLLRKSVLSSEQLSKLTGVGKERLEDFLDDLIDQGKIVMDKDRYKAVVLDEK